MKLEINTNGSWRTVLRDLTSEDLATVETATESLCDVAYRAGGRLGFRLVGNNGAALAHCDAPDCVWVPAQQVAG